MAIYSLGVTSVAFLCLGFFLDPVHGDECSLITTGIDQYQNCDTIYFEGYYIKKNSTDVRVTLPSLQKVAAWNCGPHFEYLIWGLDANPLLVHFQSNGEVQWRAYKCSNLEGPKKAGDNCAVAEVITFCPGVPDGNHTDSCIYEVKTRYEGERRVTTVTQVSAGLGLEIKHSPSGTKGSAQWSVRRIITRGDGCGEGSIRVKTIPGRPPGFSFCSFTNNTSEADIHTPTGFKWVCYLPRFVQIKGTFENVPCTAIKKCAKDVCSGANKVTINEESKGFSIPPLSTFVLAFTLACAMFLSKPCIFDK